VPALLDFTHRFCASAAQAENETFNESGGILGMGTDRLEMVSGCLQDAA
jgi:hypothetical protein